MFQDWNMKVDSDCEDWNMKDLTPSLGRYSACSPVRS
jgi:hypothetical protein